LVRNLGPGLAPGFIPLIYTTIIIKGCSGISGCPFSMSIILSIGPFSHYDLSYLWFSCQQVIWIRDLSVVSLLCEKEILMDFKMPGMDGFEATRQIREFNKDVIIIGQTAFGLTGDKEKAIEAGCNDYIAKPIVVDVLKAIIKKHFSK